MPSVEGYSGNWLQTIWGGTEEVTLHTKTVNGGALRPSPRGPSFSCDAWAQNWLRSRNWEETKARHWGSWHWVVVFFFLI